MFGTTDDEDSEKRRIASPEERYFRKGVMSLQAVIEDLTNQGGLSIEAAKKKAQELSKLQGSAQRVEVGTLFRKIKDAQEHQNRMQAVPLDERRDLFYEKVGRALKQGSIAHAMITQDLTKLEIGSDGLVTLKVSGEFIKSRCLEPATLEAISSAAWHIGCKDTITVSVDPELAAVAEDRAKQAAAADSSQPRSAKKAIEPEDLASRCQYLSKNLKTNCEHLNRERDRWDELIFGPCNKLAQATVEEALNYFNSGRLKDHVAFINGDSATGKTALLQGISWIIQRHVKDAITQLREFDRNKLNKPEHSKEFAELMRRAGFKLRYATAEDITNEFQLVGRKVMTMIDFEARYANLDVLIVDDIQYLNQQDKAVGTKRELYKIVNRMMENNKFLICASDVPFSELKALDRRVQTRIGNGIRASIDHPDADVKMQAFVKCLEKRRKVITNGYRADFEVIIDRAPDFRAVESIAATYCKRLDELGESPMDALLYLKKQYPSAAPKDIVSRIGEIISVGSTMANLAGHPEQFRDSRDGYVAAIREAAVYVTYMLASREKGAMAATFLRNQWGFKKNEPIKRIIDKFEKMKQDGFVVPEDQINSAATSAAMFTTFYGVYREYLGRMKDARELPLFKDAGNAPAMPDAVQQGEPAVLPERADNYSETNPNPPEQPEK